ncbi:hypothetical protein [Butyrivibrio sp. M55]|uniref:hypothetical protein n=1 Tax=Butyrivibrio sp. M55 TaxID=1855323 RepID=UPI0008ED9065|nr:hypothetical protein [Butyrivibrio sp. M55]SFU89435.1 hypothetical protein SAMN05216540_11821 [Butyrivibrio sp. M55]
MEIAKDWLKSLLSDAFTSFDTLVQNAIDVLTGGGEFFKEFIVWHRVISMSQALKPFCYIVIGICLLIELSQVASKVDIIKWEHGLKIAIKMALSKVMIDIAPTFLRACYNQASLWINKIGNSGGSSIGEDLVTPMITEVDRVHDFFQPWILLVVVLIPLIAIKVCGLLIEVIAFGRMFELYCLLCISPLPCAFFPLGDGSGGGYSRITRKFFLNFIGVCLHGVMIIISIKIFGLIMTGAVEAMSANVGGADPATNVSNLCYSMLLGGIVLVMACAKSGQWAKSVLDAG